MLKVLKASIKRIPFLGKYLTAVKENAAFRRQFNNSPTYWEKRYAAGGNSGSGSYKHLAEFKAGIINEFLQENQINRTIEFGCGDGNQLGMISYRNYIGLDVSKTAVKICAEKYKSDPSKSFFLYDSQSFFDKHGIFRTDLGLSLDVIYHIIEDEIFQKYMTDLMNSAGKFVIIYSSNFASSQYAHVKHRKFSSFIEEMHPEWELIRKIQNPYAYSASNEDNTSSADFYIYKRKS